MIASPSTNGTTVQYRAALAYRDSGQSVLPIGNNKRPGRDLPQVWDEEHAEYRQTWDPLKDRLPTDEELQLWFSGSDPAGIGIINGKISGNRETIDFDYKADEVFPAWCELVSEIAPNLLAKMSVVKTPGGFHVAYRCEQLVPGNTKLAMPADSAKPYIETRGEGGYVVAPGSPAKCHPTGKTYEYHSGPRLSQIQTITASEREILIRCALSFDETEKVERINHGSFDNLHPAGLRVGDDFNARGTWEEVFRGTAVEIARQRGAVCYLRRPGKQDDGWSATTGRCRSKAGHDLLMVYTTAWPPFEGMASYSKFSAYALLHHRGDFKAAAKELATKGYGNQAAPNSYHSPPWQDVLHEEWQPPIPLQELDEMPLFDVRFLPTWLANWVMATEEATQTPTDLAGLLSLGIAGAAIAKKVRVEIRPGWEEPANIYTVTGLSPGERKSSVFAAALAPVHAFEAEEVEKARDLIAEAASELRVMEATLKVTESQAAKADGTDVQALKAEAKELAKAIASFVVPAKPQVFLDDATPEAISNLLAQQGGRILIASPEGTILEIAKGRYADSANFDVFLKGHVGDPLRVNRISRETEIVNQPALSIALTVQPDVIRGLNNEPSLRARGFLARFFYGLPTSKVGARAIAAPPVPYAITTKYLENMLALWRMEWNLDSDGNRTSYIVPFSAEADLALRRFETWLEPQLKPDAELAVLAGWANKLSGAIARLSLIIHMVDTVDLGDGWRYPIDAATVEMVIEFAKGYLIPHAMGAFGLMVGSAAQDDAQKIIRRLQEANCEFCEYVKGGPCFFTKRDLHVNVFGGSRTLAEVERALDLLEAHGFIRAVEKEQKRGRGRKPSQLYEVNPFLNT